MSEYETDFETFWRTDNPTLITESIQDSKENRIHHVYELQSKLESLIKNYKPKPKTSDKVLLSYNNTIMLPEELTEKLGWRIGDELYADMFDDELKQIVVGKKLEREDAVKVLDKISTLLNE